MLWISANYMLGKKYTTGAHGLDRWYNDITGQPFRGLESAKWNIREPRDLVICRRCSISETNSGRNRRASSSMHYCITIKRMVGRYYYYTLLRCNDPLAFTMLPWRHMLICNDFLHCWWPSWCFCSNELIAIAWLIAILLATYLYESSLRHTVDGNILHVDYLAGVYLRCQLRKQSDSKRRHRPFW